jgi:hypothetical protein
VRHLPQTEQRKVLFSVLKSLSAEHLDRLGRCESESNPTIAAVAGVLNAILGKDENGRRHLVEWLTASSGAGLGEGIGIRRAVMAVISQNREDVVNVLEKSLAQFGDQLYIKHSPVLQQEGRYPDHVLKVTGTDQFDSPRPGPAPGRWIRAQVNTDQAGPALTIQRLAECHLKPTGRTSSEGPFPGHGGGRSALCPCRQRG